ncbi:MAG: hypothetical protein JXQ66_01200 [Campylobacterales bacterium]|nr:hypothetical protein [Campylobacterales bacterium]
MFVSSYSTFIHNININKTRPTTETKFDEKQKSNFKVNLEEHNSKVLTSKPDASTPINYISNYKAFANQQKLQNDEKLFSSKKDSEKFSSINSLKNAKESYEVNSRMFPRVRIPHITLSNVMQDTIDLPKALQNTMVNTYIDNERYFQITA